MICFTSTHTHTHPFKFSIYIRNNIECLPGDGFPTKVHKRILIIIDLLHLDLTIEKWNEKRLESSPLYAISKDKQISILLGFYAKIGKWLAANELLLFRNIYFHRLFERLKEEETISLQFHILKAIENLCLLLAPSAMQYAQRLVDLLFHSTLLVLLIRTYVTTIVAWVWWLGIKRSFMLCGNKVLGIVSLHFRVLL